MGDYEELKIVTFNTNGLGEFKKRKDVSDFLRKQSANIFLLQELFLLYVKWRTKQISHDADWMLYSSLLS